MMGKEETVLSDEINQKRAEANAAVFEKISSSRPMLTGVAPALEVVPGMTPNTILTSGAPLDWSEYAGGQRRAIINAAIYEGLADDESQAISKLDSGAITVSTTQEHNCIGSVAGIYTASMPVLIVKDAEHGNSAFCNLYEGKSRYRLNYGAYNTEVYEGLKWLEHTLGPVLSDALSINGPIDLVPLMARALRLGDELHSRNTAGTLLFERELTGSLFKLAQRDKDYEVIQEVLDFFDANDYTFLRIGMAAAKATADAAHGVEYSSVLTGMAINCREFAIRVSGLGDEWFRGAFPDLEGRFFEGFTAADAEWIGGESCVTETIGLGGFAQACAPTLMDYQGGTYQAMLDNNLAMYEITVGENRNYQIPAFDFRGTPTGIDLFKVLQSDVTPVIDGGLAGKEGGQIGAGVLRTNRDVFVAAANSYLTQYGSK